MPIDFHNTHVVMEAAQTTPYTYTNTATTTYGFTGTGGVHLWPATETKATWTIRSVGDTFQWFGNEEAITVQMRDEEDDDIEIDTEAYEAFMEFSGK